ncbi:MAG TPA: hypothetical protein RMH99_24445 [Sandaracinaceae bacterium LLY-WYZ-13_1]|nr:hypothetical protein [Sandaracinaceae bacterium LLY-WYZ-13_1]
MFAFERRWAAAILGGFAPSAGPGLAPAEGEVDWARGVRRFLARASAKGRLGVRVGLLLVVTAPIWGRGRLRSAVHLPPDERAALLEELLAHRFFVVRELCLLLKLVACMTLFTAPGMRERVAYDPPAERRLPVVREVA